MKALIILTSGIRFLMFISGIICAYFGLKFFEKTKPLRGFLILSILSSIDSFSYLYFAIVRSNKESFTILSEHTQLIYLVVEIYVITDFLLKSTIKDNHISNKYSFLTYTIPFTLILINYLFFNVDFLIVILELVIINLFSIKYFLNYYNTTKINRNRNRHLITGLFIFINMTAPYYIIQSNIESNAAYMMSYINFINDLGYTILFISIIKEIKWVTKN